jgi:hypothetical protein
MRCQTRQTRDFGAEIWDVPDSYFREVSDYSSVSINFFVWSILIRVSPNIYSCLTGLPIEGALLHRQHDNDYSGLQIFSGLSLLLGTLFLGLSTSGLAKQRGTWKV